MKFAALFLLLLALACPATSWCGASRVDADVKGADVPEPAPPLEEGVVQAEIPGIAERDFLAQYSGDTLFLPYLQFCDFLRIPAGISADGHILEGSFPRDRKFQFDRTAHRATLGAITIDFLESDIREVKGDLYIRQSVFCKTIGLAATFDITKLTLLVTADERLPVVQQKRNQGRYAAIVSGENGLGAIPAPSIDRNLLGSPIVDWTFANSINGGHNSAGGTVNLGADFLYGELNLGLTGGTERAALGAPPVRLSNWVWRFYAPDVPALQQITIGNLNIGRQQVQGLGLTNIPLARQRSLGEHDIRGRTQPGWMVEMYDGAKLVDVVRADSVGEYVLSVPVGYGVVDRVLRYVGPLGEVFTERRRLQLNPQMIPAGDLRYTIEAGTDRISANGNILAQTEIGYGLTQRLTIGAGGIVRPTPFRELAADSVSPSLFATMWLGEATSVALRYGVSERIFSGSYYTLFNSNATIRLAVDSMSIRDRNIITSASGWLPLGSFGIGGEGRLTVDSTRSAMQIIPRISGYVAGINFIASTTLERSGRTLGTAGGLELAASDMRITATPFEGLLLAANAEYDHRSNMIAALDLSLYARLGSHVGVGLNYSVADLDWRHGTAQLQLEFDLGAARLFGVASRESGHDTYSMFARGSAMLSGAGVISSSDFAVGKAAVVVKAYNDRNNNGLRDAGEPYLDPPRTDLTIGGMGMGSLDGVYTSLVPNTEWLLEVDRWDYAADGLYPGRTRYRVYLAPNGISTIEIPYQAGFDASGRCVVGDSVVNANRGSAASGLRVQLVSESNGSVYDGEVFYDGTVLMSGVSAGTYKLAFDPEQLESRGLLLAAPPERFYLDPHNHRIPTVEFTRSK